MKVNVGAGKRQKKSGWISLDVDVNSEPDILRSATDLPFKDGTVDQIYFGHVLEHLDDQTDAVIALCEAKRVLRTGGQLGVVGPAYDYAVDTGQPDWLLESIESRPGNGHLWTATSVNTLHLVQSVFETARIVPVYELMWWNGWPGDVPHDWQVAIRAGKAALTEDERAAGRARAMAFMDMEAEDG